MHLYVEHCVMESWKGKIVLITGAASGIGEGVVRLMLERGVKHVAVLDVAEDSGRALENELNTKYGPNSVKFYKCDVTDEELFLELFDTVKNEQGYLDVVINNAAIMNDSYKSYKKQIDINVTALVTGTLKAIEIMGKQNGGKGGTVLNISSVAALCQSHLFPIYFGTKSAVLQFSNCIGEINILDINEANAKSLQDELNAKHGVGKVKFIKCDVANHESLVAAFEAILSDKNNEYVVLNNAAILNDSLKTYRKQIDINVAAVITGSLKALDLMRKDKGGKGGAIINMSSIAALCPLPFTPIYNATKSAVMQFSVCLGADDYYSRTGVRVLTMCFGATDTSLIAIENMGSFDEVIETKLGEPLKLYPGQK